MAKSFSYPLSVGLCLRDQLSRIRFPGNEIAVAVLPCAGFDAFWAALRKKKSHLLLAVRSREVLEWHFRFALLQNVAWIYIVEGMSGLAAYLVFLRQDNPESGLTRVRLADFQCLEQERTSDMLRAMLQTAIDRCRHESVHMLELIGLAPAFDTKLQRASPRKRRLPNWVYFYKANDPSLGERLKNPAVWEPSLFDGDSSL